MISQLSRFMRVAHASFAISSAAALALVAFAAFAAPPFDHESSSVYQWSVTSAPPDKDRMPGRAFLWIPEKCAHLWGVVVGQQNMLEEPIFECPAFRGVHRAQTVRHLAVRRRAKRMAEGHSRPPGESVRLRRDVVGARRAHRTQRLGDVAVLHVREMARAHVRGRLAERRVGGHVEILGRACGRQGAFRRSLPPPGRRIRGCREPRAPHARVLQRVSRCAVLVLRRDGGRALRLVRRAGPLSGDLLPQGGACAHQKERRAVGARRPVAHRLAHGALAPPRRAVRQARPRFRLQGRQGRSVLVFRQGDGLRDGDSPGTLPRPGQDAARRIPLRGQGASPASEGASPGVHTVQTRQRHGVRLRAHVHGRRPRGTPFGLDRTSPRRQGAASR